MTDPLPNSLQPSDYLLQARQHFEHKDLYQYNITKEGLQKKNWFGRIFAYIGNLFNIRTNLSVFNKATELYVGTIQKATSQNDVSQNNILLKKTITKSPDSSAAHLKTMAQISNVANQVPTLQGVTPFLTKQTVTQLKKFKNDLEEIRELRELRKKIEFITTITQQPPISVLDQSEYDVYIASLANLHESGVAPEYLQNEDSQVKPTDSSTVVIKKDETQQPAENMQLMTNFRSYAKSMIEDYLNNLNVKSTKNPNQHGNIELRENNITFLLSETITFQISEDNSTIKACFNINLRKSNNPEGPVIGKLKASIELDLNEKRLVLRYPESLEINDNADMDALTKLEEVLVPQKDELEKEVNGLVKREPVVIAKANVFEECLKILKTPNININDENNNELNEALAQFERDFDRLDFIFEGGNKKIMTTEDLEVKKQNKSTFDEHLDQICDRNNLKPNEKKQFRNKLKILLSQSVFNAILNAGGDISREVREKTFLNTFFEFPDSINGTQIFYTTDDPAFEISENGKQITAKLVFNLKDDTGMIVATGKTSLITDLDKDCLTLNPVDEFKFSPTININQLKTLKYMLMKTRPK
jgi:hypothetical protein